MEVLIPRKWIQIFLGLSLVHHMSCDCRLPDFTLLNSVMVTSEDIADIENQDVAEELTVLKFACPIGYSLVGDQFLQCFEDKWTDEVPFCEEWSCPGTPFVPNAKIVVKYVDSGDSGNWSLVEYSCDFGYELENENASTLLCGLDVETGSLGWHGEEPVCLEMKCPDPPLVENATFAVKHVASGVSQNWSVVEYTCNLGYELVNADASTLRCDLDSLTRTLQWLGKMPFCKEMRSCPDPGFSVHGKRAGDCCLPGQMVFFSCNEGYERVGESEITCLVTGNWSSWRPLCRPMYNEFCDFPTPIPNGTLKNNRQGDYFVPEEEAEVKCRPGYRCEGNKFVVCEKGGTWAKDFGVCKEIFCDPPPPLTHGHIPELRSNHLKRFPYNFELNYVCDKGYQIFKADGWRVCSTKGTWSGATPICRAIRCPDPGTPENGFKSGSNYSVGSRIRFGCSSGFKLLGTSEILCQSNGQWAGEPARCNLPSNYCPDPGSPIRGSKNKSKYQMGDRVRFRCEPGAFLLGSSVRQCLTDGTWSGSPTRCVGSYDFDNAAQVGNRVLAKMVEVKERQRREWQAFEEALKASGGWQGKHLPTNFPGMLMLYFAFDVSGSITESNFRKSIDFAKAVVKQMGVSKFRTRVGAITFASKAEGIFLPLHYETTEDVLKALGEIQYTGGGTSASSALKFVREEYIPLVGRNLPNVEIKSVIFVITDGRANMGGDPKNEADLLKSAGVDIYCIGITGNITKKVLYDIASTSYYGQTVKPNVFILQDYKMLAWLVQTIANGSADYSQCGIGKAPVVNPGYKIVGGKRAPEPWPWMAALYITVGKNKIFQCGGSIIHPHFILTAAHCVHFNSTSGPRKPEEIEVKLGLFQLNDTTHRQEMAVRKIHFDGIFDYSTYDNDVALLELSNPIQYNEFVRPVCLPPKVLPEDSSFYKPESVVTIAGWGHVSMVGKRDAVLMMPSNFLKEISLPIKPRETCVDSLRDDEDLAKHFSDNMFCAGTGGERNDTCQGDSGGPVMQSHLNEEGYICWTQVGIVSWGMGCGVEREYGVYTHLHRVMPWVNKSIKDATRWMKP